MARPLDIGVQAQHDYQDARYSQFDSAPGSPASLVANPWAFLANHLTRRLPHSRGKNRRCSQRALDYATMAEAFYTASSHVAFPVRATLAYYGMLNLSKSLLSVRGVELEQGQEHHGLSIATTTKPAVEIHGRSSNTTNMFYEFARVLGTPVTRRDPLGLAETISHAPELHEIAFTCGVLPTRRRSLLPISITFLVTANLDWLFTELMYVKKQEVRVQTTRFHTGARKRYFREPRELDGSVIFRSRRRKRLTKHNWPRLYANILREYKAFSLASILTRDGYRFYCDLMPRPYHHLCYSLILMFFIGAVARYRPKQLATLLGSDYRPVLLDATATEPFQLLYQLVGHITGSDCLIPFSAIG